MTATPSNPVQSCQPTTASLPERLRTMPSSLNDACRTMDEAAERIEYLEKALLTERANVIDECALVAEGFDAACDSSRMKLFVDAGLVVAVYKRDGEIGQAIRARAVLDPKGAAV